MYPRSTAVFAALDRSAGPPGAVDQRPWPRSALTGAHHSVGSPTGTSLVYRRYWSSTHGRDHAVRRHKPVPVADRHRAGQNMSWASSSGQLSSARGHARPRQASARAADPPRRTRRMRRRSWSADAHGAEGAAYPQQLAAGLAVATLGQAPCALSRPEKLARSLGVRRPGRPWNTRDQCWTRRSAESHSFDITESYCA